MNPLSNFNRFTTVRGVAIHDDLTLVGSVDDVLQATEFIIEEAKRFSLDVQQNKCKLIYFHSDTAPLTAQQEQSIQTLQLPSIMEGTTILGCPFAKVDSTLRSLLEEESDNKLFDERKPTVKDSTVSAQVAIILL